MRDRIIQRQHANQCLGKRQNDFAKNLKGGASVDSGGFLDFGRNAVLEEGSGDNQIISRDSRRQNHRPPRVEQTEISDR